jgi:hypothetical protein
MATILALGCHMKPLERIACAGDLLGLTRSTSYRQSPAWPLVGTESSTFVLMIPFLELHGIPYTIESDSDVPHD